MKPSNLAFIAAFTIALCLNSIAQVGIGTFNPQSSLDIRVGDPANPNSNEGVLIPRITSFPTVDPALAQHGMLVYMNNPAAYAGEGFYYWDNTTTTWLPLADNKWKEGTNACGDDLIYAINADTGGTKIVVKDDGFVGMGTDDPTSELHVLGNRNTGGTDVELTIDNLFGDADLQLVPGGLGSASYTFTANNDATNGLSITEDGVEKLQIKTGGDFRIDELNTAKNSGVVYPAAVYAEADGTIKVKTAYSRLDDLTVDLTDFATVDYAESITSMGTDATAALYTHTLTPTQDILLEVSYQVSVNFTKYGHPSQPIEQQHQTKLYGTIVRLNGVDYTYKTNPVISNFGLNGAFIAADHLYIPLVADGTTYNISIHGYIQNDTNTEKGIRGTFGGDSRDQLQIVEHK